MKHTTNRYRNHVGWYKIVNSNKFIKPIDETMNSTVKKDNDVFVKYKSSLERRAFVYADLNPKVKYFSIEPFAIEYIKPVDNCKHRYYIDMFIEFTQGAKFLVEIKSSSETKLPDKPKHKTPKSMMLYKSQIETFLVNQAKWKSADMFARSRGMKFIVLTEHELK